jgi:hypothetical protein
MKELDLDMNGEVSPFLERKRARLYQGDYLPLLRLRKSGNDAAAKVKQLKHLSLKNTMKRFYYYIAILLNMSIVNQRDNLLNSSTINTVHVKPNCSKCNDTSMHKK